MNLTSASIALMQLQTLGSLSGVAGGAKPGDNFGSMFEALLGAPPALSPLQAVSGVLAPAAASGLSPTGRNMALFDPESAYRMMTLINTRDVEYKAQFSELDQMRAQVSQMQSAGKELADVAASGADIKGGLLAFVERYNNWVQRFAPDMQQGGVLNGTRAAQVSRFELEQNFGNPFFGAGGGVQGLRALGVEIDPVTHLARVDVARLDAALAANPSGAAGALQEFGNNFARSAELLNSANNFIPRQLDNLDRAIRFIADNQSSLRAEFGTGDPAKPTGQVAQALAAYNAAHAA